MSLGEFDLIRRITADLHQSPSTVLGPGDDAAVLRPNGDVVVSTDLLVEGVHFRRTWSPAFQVGRKSIAVNVSDVEAMGAVPISVVVALAVPADLDPAWHAQFSDGVRDECARSGVSLVGGDLSSSEHITICVTAIGEMQGRSPVTRAGARPGDVVAVCGRLGWSSAGLTVLQRGFGSPKELVTEHQCPTVPYGQGRVAADGGATSMMDVSDGLLADLGHIAMASGVAIDVRTEDFEVGDAVARVCAATGKSPWGFVLAGGEDHALVATFPAGTTLPELWRPVGSVAEGDGLTVDGEPWEGATGWDHFAR
ncbi:MAG: thiamine-phosphate kinase [Propionibacteriaceae bacterium]|nr:thiamine-phosphate kinase [Propionibacteriaceae bacterium]